VEGLTQNICQSTQLVIPLVTFTSDEVDAAENLQYSFNTDVAATITIDAALQTLTILPPSFFFGDMHIQVEVCDNATPSLCATGNIAITVAANTTPQITAATINQIACFGNNDGSIVIENVVEETGVEYVWSDGNTTNTIDSLAAGNYELQLNGLSACSTPLQALFTITEPEALELAITSQAISAPNSGLIESNVSGGTQPYNYEWQGPNNFSSTEPSLMNLNSAGLYSLLVNDANGCTTEATILLTPTEYVSDRSFSIYPNPSEGPVNICIPMDATVGATLRIIDAYGREVLSKKTERQNEFVQFDFLCSGTYQVIVTGAAKEYRSTVVVTK
jgi:hypothetical protein